MNNFPSQFSYVPILNLRPAEMAAIEELPNFDKDSMLPLFRLQRWVGSHDLKSSVDRLNLAFGNRASLLDIGQVRAAEQERPVHSQLRELQDPTDGFRNWTKFLEDDMPNSIPILQISDPNTMRKSIHDLISLNRGLGIVVNRPRFPYVDNLFSIIESSGIQNDDLIFIYDFETITGISIGSDIELANVLLSQAHQKFESSRFVVAGTSFPSTFVDLAKSPILERRLFQTLKPEIRARVIYGDHGSTRIESQSGGAGAPAPRIDFATRDYWYHFRSLGGLTRFDEYVAMARNCMSSTCWDPMLRVWGTQMIERTSLQDDNGIGSTARAVASRINIHFHQQLHYGNPAGLYSTDEEWVD